MRRARRVAGPLYLASRGLFAARGARIPVRLAPAALIVSVLLAPAVAVVHATVVAATTLPATVPLTTLFGSPLGRVLHGPSAGNLVSSPAPTAFLAASVSRGRIEAAPLDAIR